MKRVYLDYNATTPLDSTVKDVFIQAIEDYANPSSMHEDGRVVAKKIFEARDKIARLIGANAEEIVFTSGGTESNNMVFNTMLSPLLLGSNQLKKKYKGRKKIIISEIEHPCVLEAAKKLAQYNFDICMLPVDSQGIVDFNEYNKLLFGENNQGFDNLNEKPLLVSIMMANNEIGTIQNIKQLSALAHKAGALFHTDAVQAIGKIPVDVKNLGVDYATLSGHKIYAPKGIGALYIKKSAPIDALIKGGHQEKGLRAGTYNAPAIIAFGEAARIAKEGQDSYEKHTLKLRNKLKESLLKTIPNIHVNGHPEHVLPNTINISFPGAEGESILLMFDLLGISVSTGSACASGNLEPSHVLIATGAGPELAHGSIRFSLGKNTTEEEIDYVIKEIPAVIEKLRSYSTLAIDT